MSVRKDPLEVMQARFDALALELATLLAEAHEMGLKLRLVAESPPAPLPLPPPPLERPPPGKRPIVTPLTDWRATCCSLLASVRSEGVLPDEEVQSLMELVADEDRLLGFPKDVQVFLLQYAAARMRFLQECGVQEERIRTFMAIVAKFAKHQQCGFVNGPMRTSLPKELMGWEADARGNLNSLYDRVLTDDRDALNPGRVLGIIEETIRDAAPFEEVRPLIASALRVGIGATNTRLVNLTAPFLGLMESSPELKSLRNAIRTRERDVRVAQVESESEMPAIPSDWPWLPFTRGKRAVMIGGESREPNRLRIKKAFTFEELAWETAEFSPRSIGAVRERIMNGGVDFLIILRRFIGHDTDNQLIPACVQTDLPWISVERGYGISAIRQEIERRIPRPDTSSS